VNETWMIRFRTRLFWRAVRSAFRTFGLWGAIKNIKHNLAQPRKSLLV